MEKFVLVPTEKYHHLLKQTSVKQDGTHKKESKQKPQFGPPGKREKKTIEAHRDTSTPEQSKKALNWISF